MRLFFHQFRKDFSQTRIIWLVWFLFVVVQFGLAAWNVNPGDVMNQGIYSELIGLVPMIHSILLFVLIPALILQEPTIGVTAFWFTRPMPRPTILGSKLLALFILVIVPLIGQCVVLASHGIVFRDVVLAGIEIGLNELTWIALVTVLASLSPNFGWFLIASVVFFALEYFSGWIFTWITVLTTKKQMVIVDQDDVTTLWQSRVVATDLLRIAFSIGIVLVQYLSRRTRLSVILVCVGLLFSFLIQQFWPWNFLKIHPETTAASLPFDASKVKLEPCGNVNLFDQPDWEGGKPMKTMNLNFSYSGIDPKYKINVHSKKGELALPDGGKIPLLSMNQFGFNSNRADMFQIESAIGNIPLITCGGMNEEQNCFIPLFSIDADTFAKNVASTGTATFHMEGKVAHFQILSEIPLKKGAEFTRESYRTTVIDVLQNPDGVDLTLHNRSVRLLLKPKSIRVQNTQPVYILVNRKREEAIVGSNSNQFEGFDEVSSTFGGPLRLMLGSFGSGETKIEHITPIHLSFGPPENWKPRRNLPVALDSAWLADATLVTLEEIPDGDFDTTVKIPNFTLDGKSLEDGNIRRGVGPDVAALNKITLPENPTRGDIWNYLFQIESISRNQQSMSDKDPQIEMVKKLGPEHATEMLLAISAFQSHNYELEALKTFDLKQKEEKDMVLRLLEQTPELIEVVTKNHWEKDAEQILFKRIVNQKSYEYLNDEWIPALASLRDPTTYDALISNVESKTGDFNQGDQCLDQIRDLPGPLVQALVERVWKKAHHTKDEVSFIKTAACWGLTDALDRAAEILTEPVDNDKDKQELRDEARDVFHSTTPCPDHLLDGDIVTWYHAKKGKLVFDTNLGHFLFHAPTPAPDQSWPTANHYMQTLAERAAKGDTTAIDEIDSAWTRLTEGLDPKQDEGRINNLRNIIWEAFYVLRDMATKEPDVFPVLEYANQKKNLRSFIPCAYARAAAEGNDAALNTLIHYSQNHWTLEDTIDQMDEVLRKSNPKAVDFILGVFADPTTKSLPHAQSIRDKLTEEIQEAANAGSEKAKKVYQTLHKSS